MPSVSTVVWINFPGAGKRKWRKDRCTVAFLLCISAMSMHFSLHAPSVYIYSDFSASIKGCAVYICRQTEFQRLTLARIPPVTWTVCKCAAARTHSTPTQLKLHLRWKVTGPVHCLGNGRRCCWREQHLQCDDVIRKKGQFRTDPCPVYCPNTKMHMVMETSVLYAEGAKKIIPPHP